MFLKLPYLIIKGARMGLQTLVLFVKLLIFLSVFSVFVTILDKYFYEQTKNAKRRELYPIVGFVGAIVGLLLVYFLFVI